MAKVVITAAITDQTGVLLSSSQPNLPVADTFRLKRGDTLEWRLRDAKARTKSGFEGLRARVRFVGFPREGERPLLANGNTLEATKNGVITGGAVNPAAFKGQYHYLVELVSPDGAVTNLECSWAPAGGGPPTLTGMGGGKRQGSP